MITVEPSLWLFFGRLHPLVLHFPVALLIVAALLEVFIKVRKKHLTSNYQSAILFLLVLGALSAITAASMGWSLASSGGYQGETIYWHKRFGIAVAILSIFSITFKYLHYKKALNFYRYPYRISLTLCVLAIFTAGHYGGALTHGSEFLPSAAPEPLASWLREGEEKSTHYKAKLTFDTFTQKVKPILEKHCVKCHGNGKQQGGLQLNKQTTAYTGGESGLPTIKPGNPLESEMIRRLFLSRNSKKAMPPEGKPRPSDEELVTLMDWITSGAPWAGESAGPRGFLADHLAKELPSKNNNDTNKQEEQALIALQQANVSVKKVNKNNPLLMVNMSLIQLKNQEIVRLLTPLKNKITWLNLANNQLDNHTIELIISFKYLTHLSVANSQLSNQQAVKFKQLTNLTSLNLIGNKQLNDNTIRALVQLPMLQRLYLWQTAISKKLLTELVPQYPDVKLTEINTMKMPTITTEDSSKNNIEGGDK